MKSNRFLVQHLLPFFISILVLIIFLYSPYKKIFIHYDEPPPWKSGLTPPPLPSRIFVNLNENMNAEWTIRNAFHFGRPVVMGSSEMSHADSKAIPYNFFQDRGINCFGVGHEGNQLLSILVQLAAFHDDLDKTKLVIILSPGWFEGSSAKGTPLQTFLEYADEHILYYLWYDKEIPAAIKDHIYDYIVDHFKDIDSPSSVIRAIYYSRSAERNSFLKPFYFPFSNLHQYYMGVKKEIMSDKKNYMTQFIKPPFPANAEFPDGKHLPQNWDSLYETAIKDFSVRSANNDLGIDNDYYDAWMKGKGPRTLKIVEEKDNVEFNDLKMLLVLLKHYNCKPLFVMQGLNPLVFSNIKELDPTLKRVKEEIEKNKFELLDLHTSDRSTYIKGMLSDYQHMGDAGWYKVDEKIFNYFLKTDK